MSKSRPPSLPISGGSPHTEPDSTAGRTLHRWPALLLLAASLVVTALVTHQTQRGVVAKALLEFKFAGDAISIEVRERLRAHEQILLAGAGLFAASESVSRAEWRAYVQSLQVERQLPGILGVGYTLLIPPERLAQHEVEIRQEGFPDYHVWPEGQRAIYSSIVYLEPFTNRNLRAFGYDMLSEPTRRAALERARDENTAAMTSKVKLVQETSTDVQAGTLEFVPVYRKGMPVATVAERRAALQGWVYSPYRMNDLMSGILGGWGSLEEKRIRLQVFDDKKSYKKEDKEYRDFLLYDSQPDQSSAAEFTLQKQITYAGRPWTLLFTQSSAPASVGAYRGVWGVAGTGTALSLLLAGLLYSLLNTRFTARRLAERLTADLQHTTKRLELATEAGGVGIWDYEVVSNRLIWDDQMFRLYGTTRAQFSGAYEAWTAGVHPEDRQRGDEEIQQALRGEKDFNTEFRVSWADGTIHYIRAVAQVQRDASGQPLRMLGTNWDITDRKKVEVALQESEENILTLLNSTAEAIYGIDLDGMELGADDYLCKPVSKGVLLAAIRSRLEKHRQQQQRLDPKFAAVRPAVASELPHELLTPLTDLLAAGQLLAAEDPTKPCAGIRDIGRVIRLASERLQCTIQRYLSYAELMAASQDEKAQERLRGTESISVTSFTADLAKRLAQRDSRLNDLQLDLCEVEAGLSSAHFAELVTELVDNAFKFSAPGSVVRVHLNRLPEGGCLLEVVDHGRGMTPGQLSQVEAFRQFDSERWAQAGTGLGLALVQQITALYQSRFAIESEPARGTRVAVRLPNARRETHGGNQLDSKPG